MYSSSMATFQTIINDMTALNEHLKTLLTEEVDAVVSQPSQDIMVSVLQLPDDMLRLIGTFIDTVEPRRQDARRRYQKIKEIRNQKLDARFYLNQIAHLGKVTAKCFFIYDKRIKLDDTERLCRVRNSLIDSEYFEKQRTMNIRYNDKYWKSNINFTFIDGRKECFLEDYDRDRRYYFDKLTRKDLHIQQEQKDGCLFLWQGTYRANGI